MTVAGVEIKLQHLGVGLIEVPVVMIEAIDGSHDSGAMAATSAMYKELPGRRIINHFQKGIHLFGRRITLVDDRDIHVVQARSLNRRLLILTRVIGQIDNRFDTKLRKRLVVFCFWTGSTIEALIQLSKITNLNVRETVVMLLRK